MATAHFRSRARVIDLLGRQQIADAPTAVGELFKNSLDAGASDVWIDYTPPFEKDGTDGRCPGFLHIRDNGLGMRKQDVTDKWLVLATESKFRKIDDGWSRFASPQQREWLNAPSYGEKGIGRLSVASLGRMTMLWTVWGEGEDKRGTLCIVHWNLFRHPLKLFEALPIPIAEFDHLLSESEFAELFRELARSEEIESLFTDRDMECGLRKELERDMHLPMDVLWAALRPRWEVGTTFLCVETPQETAELFVDGTEKRNVLSESSPSRLKAANAFASFWDPFHPNSTRPFSVHPSKAGVPLWNRENAADYWAIDDFSNCDHHIRIEVSPDGFAKGFIQNYNDVAKEFERQLPALPVGFRSPGPFLVEIGYVQGQIGDTFLPADIHKKMDGRLKGAGGFSIYKNNVHIQPYGSVDSDFAGFEQRRLKNAGRYYFSHLRMFGGVFLDDRNSALKEKAGREGFIENGACKGLRYWLTAVFVDVADRFLGRKSERTDKVQKRREKMEHAAKVRLENLKRDYIQKITLAKGWLNDCNARIKSRVQETRRMLNSAANALPGQGVGDCERQIESLRGLLTELRSSVSIPPEGVVVAGDAWESITAYLSQRDMAIDNLSGELADLVQKLQRLLSRSVTVHEKERRYIERLESADREVRERIEQVLAPAEAKAVTLDEELRTLANFECERLKSLRESSLGGLTPHSVSLDDTGEQAKCFEKAVQLELDALEKETLPRLLAVSDNLKNITDAENGIFALSEQTRELQALREQHSLLVNAAQIGLVFSTANHEYDKQVSCVMDSIRWLEKNTDGEVRKVVVALNDSFKIIDERLRLVDPLVRRRGSRHDELKGEELAEFLERRFAEERTIVSLNITKACRAMSWQGISRPVFLGAVHNLVMNALYWAAKGRVSPAEVRLSCCDDGILVVSNTGPRINEYDAPFIFDPGFSRRPYGTGLGLYIARESLKEIGFRLQYSPEPFLGALEAANFSVSRIEKGIS